MDWNNLEDAFKDLDRKEFAVVATTLSALRDSLMSEGFTRREAMKLVEGYSKFLFDMSIEQYVAEQRQKEDEELDAEIERIFDEEDDDDVDPFDEDE